MNIMKTNMLLLNNKIRKDDAENTTTIEAPIPSKTEPQTGMKALMFQGLKNLLADPELAGEVGLKGEDDKTDKESAKSYVAPYSSNIAFQGKIKNLGMALAIGTAAIAGLTSCKDKEYIYEPKPAENTVTVTVTVDNTATNALIAGMQTVLLQMLEQQKITNEQFAEYMRQTNEWRTQTSGQISDLETKLDLLTSVLISMGSQILDGIERIGNSVEELNVYQQLLYADFKKYGYSFEEFRSLLQEANEIAKQNGKNTADGMAYIIEQLNNIHKDLGTIIDQLNTAKSQREEQTALLYSMKLTGEATEEQVRALNASVVETNKTLKEVGGNLADKLANVDKTIKDGVAFLAKKMDWTEAQTLKALKDLGINIAVGQQISTGMLYSALMGIQESIDNQTEVVKSSLDDFRGDVKAYADKVYEELQSINGRIGVFMETFVEKMDKVNAKFDKLQKTVQKTNAKLSDILAAHQEYLEEVEELKGILAQMSEDVKQIDKDVVKTKNQLAAALGIQTAVLDRAMAMLGYTYAQYSTWNANRIIDAINSAINSQNQIILANGQVLTEISDKIENIKSNTNIDDSEKLAQIIAILQGIDSKLSSFITDWTNSRNSLDAKVDSLINYAAKIYNEQKYQTGQNEEIKAGIAGIKTQLESSTTILRNIYNKIKNNEPITAAEMEAIANKLNVSITTSTEELAGLIKNEIAIEEKQAVSLDSINSKLDNLGTISQSILNDLKNLDLNSLSGLGDKIDALIAALNAYAAKVDGYAEKLIAAHDSMAGILTGIAANIDDLVAKAQTMINELKKANNKVTEANSYLTLLTNQVNNIEAKIGRHITPEELDSILAKHDADNQAFYASLKDSINVNPADFSEVLAYIDALKAVVVTGQKQTNDNLITLIGLVSKNPELADKIIAAIKDHKIEVIVKDERTAQGNNQTTEGLIHIIQ